MKRFLALLLLITPLACSGIERPGSKNKKNTPEAPGQPTPKYNSEAPLPKGWPKPGPFNKVAEKTYPDYRVATAKGGRGSFMTLFRHIKRNNIPMTAPVEMGMSKKNENGPMERTTMGFLYQNTKVGKTGPDGKRVEVKDIKKAKALSYAWMGNDSKKNLQTAREALETALKKRGVKATSFRLLGYNGPMTARKKRTWELQALLPTE